MQFFEDLKLKASVWNRERKERLEEKKAVNRRRTAEHGAPLMWIWFLVFIAVSTLIGSTWMLIVFIAGSVGSVDWAFDWRAGNDGQPGRWNWFAEANIHAIYGGGLFLFCLGIAAFNAVWLHIRHYLTGLFRSVATGIGIAIALFMVSGAIVTQQWGTDARSRDQVIATNTAVAGVAAVNAEIAAIETEMGRLCAPNLTTYQAQACRSGETAWAERTVTAREQRDYQLAGIERAMADARQGDRWRARLLELRQQAAVASVVTVEAEAAAVVSTGWMATFARFLEDVRKPFIAVLGELLAMTMFGVALAAWRSRVPATDADRSGWAPEDHRIEDLREEEAIVPRPMKPAREVVTDAETGEELIKITPKPHWRKSKGKKHKHDIQPEIPPDETGAPYDGGGRTGSVEQAPAARGAADDDAEEQQPAASAEDVKDSADGIDQTDLSQDLPETPDEDVLAIFDVNESDATEQAANDLPNIDAEQTRAADHSEPRETPETDERKLLANVAAE